jgi:hypothetical protein
VHGEARWRIDLAVLVELKSELQTTEARMDGDYKLYFYRCPDCGKEWTRKIPKGERKVRGWCSTPGCKHFVTAHNIKSITNSEREVRVTKPKPLW